MIRTALRLATVAALTGMGHEPFPTLVGRQVHDSRKDATDDVIAAGRLPIIVLRTDEDQRSQMDPRTRQPSSVSPYRSIKLRMEASVLAAMQDEEGHSLIGWPNSDAGLEAMLDLLEYQIANALQGFSPLAMWWGEVGQVESWESIPLYSAPEQGKVRLAAREITVTVRVAPECFPRPLREDQVEFDNEGEPILDNDLPPLLTKVLDKIDLEGVGATKADAQHIRASLEARELPKPSVHPTLLSVVMTIPRLSPPTGHAPALVAELLAPVPPVP